MGPLISSGLPQLARAALESIAFQVDAVSALGAAHLAGHVIGLWSRTDLDALARPHDVFASNLSAETRHTLRSGWHAAVDRACTTPGVHHEQKSWRTRVTA